MLTLLKQMEVAFSFIGEEIPVQQLAAHIIKGSSPNLRDRHPSFVIALQAAE
jgi:hypothetical protein